MATEALILRLRRAIDERIPSGGADSDTQYTDAELGTYLDEKNGNLNVVASDIWLEKATALSPSAGGIQSYSVAGESYSFAGSQEAFDHAMAMHKLYLSRVAPTLFLEGSPRGQDIEERASGDISRLTQDKAGW